MLIFTTRWHSNLNLWPGSAKSFTILSVLLYSPAKFISILTQQQDINKTTRTILPHSLQHQSVVRECACVCVFVCVLRRATLRGVSRLYLSGRIWDLQTERQPLSAGLWRRREETSLQDQRTATLQLAQWHASPFVPRWWGCALFNWKEEQKIIKS